MNINQTAKNALNVTNIIMLLYKLEHGEETTLNKEQKDAKIQETRKHIYEMCKQAIIMEQFIESKGLYNKYIKQLERVEKEMMELIK